MKLANTIITVLFFSTCIFAQKEKGKKINAPKIPQNKTQSKSEVKNKETAEFDFIFEEEPKLRFSNQYENNTQKSAPNGSSVSIQQMSGIKIEPLREINELIHDDSSSIDEGELMIVEIEEEAQFQGSEDMLNIASYFSVWDTKSLNPYHINPKEFNGLIPIKLYDINEGRKWSPMLDKSVITSHFGWRFKRWHKGTDLDLETGDPVYAAYDGIVRIAGAQSGYGRTVILRHYNGLETLYGHLSKINFEPNTIVKAGEMIARGGNSGRSSGSHLHFETRYEGNQFDPENIYNFKPKEMEIKGQEFVLSANVFDYLRGGNSRSVKFTDSGESGEIQSGGTAAQEENEDIAEDEEEIPTNVIKKVWYQVKPGDNLTLIAKRANTSVSEICRLNKISAYKKLFVGLKIRIQ